MNLYKFVSEKIRYALEKLPELASVDLSNVSVDIPKDRAFGDFATNAAMVLTKQFGKNPRAVAESLISVISELEFVEKASIAGPGFINITLKNDFITQSLDNIKISPVKEKLIIDMDYGAYNVAKSLHIGHLRTSIVGDTLNRIASALGHKIYSWNHLGDWGKPMALVIAWIEKNKIDVDKINVSELDSFYPAASKLAKEDPEFLDRVHKIKKEFQDGNQEYFSVYEKFLKISMDSMNALVKRLGILPFDYNFGERNAAKYLSDVEKILRDKNLITESDGAEIIVLKTESDNAPMPPYMWTDSRGADTYDSTDLAAVYCRKITDNPDKIIYFTDARQSLHFEQLFRASELSGIYSRKNMEHIGYGTINGADGKPFKTRDGNAAGLTDIIEMVDEAVYARIAESGKKLDNDTAQIISIAALKFNDLLHDIKSDYVFDPASVTSFEGRTGPYVLYTAVRLNSVLTKAGKKSEIKNHDTKLLDEERDLILGLLDFERALNSAFDKRDPSILANYTYDLCQLANTFYHNCPILRDDVNPDIKEHRLWIAERTLEVLSRSIDLMGLRVPKEM